MLPSSPTTSQVERPRTTRDLTEDERSFVRQMSELGFGRFESLRVARGQIELGGSAKKVRSVKFGGPQEIGAKPRDFELKAEAAAFIESIRSLDSAEIRNLEIRHGLPFSMEIEEIAGQGQIARL